MQLNAPEVTAVKHGGHITFKPNNIRATLILNDIKAFLKQDSIRNTTYFAPQPTGKVYMIEPALKKTFKLAIHKVVDQVLLLNPSYQDINKFLVKLAFDDINISAIFATYGVKLNIDPCLIGYITKEARRQKLESANYPTAPVTTDLPLFERCTVGTNLLCVKDYIVPGTTNKLFELGKRYMVVDTGDDIDKVVVSTNSVVNGSVVQLTGQGAKHEWTPFDPAMEEWFDDSSAITAPVENIKQLYPVQVAQMKKKLDSLDLVLYDHVKEDAVLQALHRGVMNCYLPRLGKTSSAIATAELIGSKKIAVLTTKNIRIFWEREFKRLKVKNYVIVNSLADLDKPGKYYVMTYNWIRSQVDHTEKPRKNHANYLKKAYKDTVKKVGNKTNVTKTSLFNHCPHCDVAMVRPLYKQDEAGRRTLEYVESKGYMCKNKGCTYTTDNSKMKGAAWHSKKVIVHKPGTYVDVFLAKHSRCPEGAIKGRMCNSCKVTDGTWKPPTYKRFTRRFTCVISDEIHNAKSIETQIAQSVYSLRARRRIGLTGTPMSNSAMDIYYPFHWVFKGPTTAFPYSGREGAKEFENQFCQHIYLDKPTGEKDANGVEIIKTVRKRIPFLADPIKFWSFIGSKVVRRTYSDPLYQQSLVNAEQKLPTLEIKKLVCDMHPQQATLMLSALQNFKDQFATMVEDAEKNKKELNEALVISQMSALRQIATSPEKMNERLGKVVYTGPNGGGKILSIKHIVETKMAAGEKVVILSDFLDMQKTCEAELKQYDPIRFQTNWDDEQREEAFREFATNPKRKVFIAGTRAVREGVDLSSANSVICCDLLWAPAFQTQAWSRTLAPTKEERTCEVYLIVSRNSLDEHMFNVFYSKMTAAEQAFDKKVLSRRAQSVDIKFFVDRVLEDTIALTMQVRDYDDNMTYIPTMNMEAFGERF
jgi:hypothetical protein